MRYLSSGFQKVNKEIKSLTCEKLRISVPPRSAVEQKKEKGEEEEEEERALLRPAPGSLPGAQSPTLPLQRQAPRFSSLLHYPFSPRVRIKKLININNSLAKSNSQRVIGVAPSPLPAYSGIQWKRRLRSITRPHPAPSPVPAPQLPSLRSQAAPPG